MGTVLTSDMVKEYGINEGADVVGIAAAKDFGSAPDGFRPTDVLPGCLSVIVLGATFSSEVLNDIAEYTASRNDMLKKMTDIAKKVERRVKNEGYRSKAISASGGKTVDNDGRKDHFGHISLKHAAEIAGLGVIGKNYLLTNPQYGNLLWLSAVLTDAKLVPDEKLDFAMCNNCDMCVRACPVGALDNIAEFKKKECSSFFVFEDKKLKIKCCLCRTICPNRFGFDKNISRFSKKPTGC